VISAKNVDDDQFHGIECIINSMTAKERHDHEIINVSRRKRIARGSGATAKEVTTTSASMPRCARCSNPWAPGPASKPSSVGVPNARPPKLWR